MTTEGEQKISRSFTIEGEQPRKLLAIPGPIEMAEEVLASNARLPVSHVCRDFMAVFGQCIRMTREVMLTRNGQPFIMSGSGTLGWDQVAANLVEQGDKVLVINTGYFGDKFAQCLETYGAKVNQLKAPLGHAVDFADLEAELKAGTNYKIVTVTYVDTSTGVLSNVERIAAIIRQILPGALIVVDAVCAVASEELRFDDWDLDVVLTASQKALGTPPGMSILVASERALEVFKNRQSPPAAYYVSWKGWLPVMEAYEAGRPSYYATPPVNLLYAYHASLKLIVRDKKLGLEKRLELHKKASKRVKDAAERLGLKQVPCFDDVAANGTTTLYCPEGVTATEMLSRMEKHGVNVSSGLQADIIDKHFIIGHMGISVVDEQRGDINTIIRALEESVKEPKPSKSA